MTEKKILVICPICSKQARIPVPIDIISSKESGATSVYVPKNMVCIHEFYAYVDQNFRVRDYLVLEYSLQAEALKIKSKINFILNKQDDLDLSFKNLLNFISERDFRSLLFACFVNSPLMFIENDLDSERFGVIFNSIARFFPKMPETCSILTPSNYLEYSKEEYEKIKKFTVYNIIYKISVQKPFLDSVSESFEHVLDFLRKESSKLQFIFAKNFIDYLFKFSEEIDKMEEMKTDKLIKLMKKKYPEHVSVFTPQWIHLMKQRKELWITPELEGEIKRDKAEKVKNIVKDSLFYIEPDSEAKIEPDKVKKVKKIEKNSLFYYNSEIHVRTAENQDTLLKKSILQIIRKDVVISMKGIIHELEKRAYERSLEFDYNLLPKIIEEFMEKGYIT